MKRKIISIIILCCTWNPLTAQDIISAKQAADEFTKINQAYSDCRGISMNISHSFFRSYSDTIPEQRYHGYYIRKDKQEHSSVAGIISVQNEDYRLTIDSANKQMSISHPVLISAGNPEAILAVMKLSKTIHLTKSASTHSYVLVFPEKNPEFAMIKINIDPKTHFIQGIVIFHSEEEEYEEGGKMITSKGRTEIRYDDVKRNPILSERKFSIKEYITLTNGKPSLTREYSGFTLINNIIR